MSSTSQCGQLITIPTVMHYSILLLCLTHLFLSISCRKCRLTSPAIQGPYYLHGAPHVNGSLCAGISHSHHRLIIKGKVLDATDCRTPLPSRIEIWQTNGDGQYSYYEYSNHNSPYDCRGTIETNARGRFVFETKFPGRYLTDKKVAGSYRPSHIHMKITPRNPAFGGSLITQLYFENDAFLGPNDHCASNKCKSNDPSLIIAVKNKRDTKTFEGRWNVYIRPGGNGINPDNFKNF